MDAMAPWDIAPSHARALGVLDAEGAIRLRDLAERLRVAPRTVTEVVDVLAERGLAERKPDPDDRRATLVELTDEGRRVHGAIHAARDASAQEFFSGLPAADRSELRRVLRLLS